MPQIIVIRMGRRPLRKRPVTTVPPAYADQMVPDEIVDFPV
jgi:hypothetical protein